MRKGLAKSFRSSEDFGEVGVGRGRRRKTSGKRKLARVRVRAVDFVGSLKLRVTFGRVVEVHKISGWSGEIRSSIRRKKDGRKERLNVQNGEREARRNPTSSHSFLSLQRLLGFLQLVRGPFPPEPSLPSLQTLPDLSSKSLCYDASSQQPPQCCFLRERALWRESVQNVSF